MRVLLLEHQSDGRCPDLGGERLGRTLAGSVCFRIAPDLSKVGASFEPGAVHSPLAQCVSPYTM